MFLDTVYLWMRKQPFFHRFTWMTRILLCAGFLPTGLVKVLGRRFTNMSTETQIGAFFEALHQTGGYWKFLGLSQMIASLLLLFPRTAHLGAAVFFPIMLNIFIITISMNFGGTPVITGLMLLAVSYLLIYDWNRFRPMFMTHYNSDLETVPKFRLDHWEFTGFLAFALGMIGAFSGVRVVQIPGYIFLPAIGVLGGMFAAGRFFFCSYMQRKQRVNRS